MTPQRARDAASGDLRPMTGGSPGGEMDGSRIPPQALDAERSVLGAMLLSRDAIAMSIQAL